MGSSLTAEREAFFPNNPRRYRSTVRHESRNGGAVILLASVFRDILGRDREDCLGRGVSRVMRHERRMDQAQDPPFLMSPEPLARESDSLAARSDSAAP